MIEDRGRERWGGAASAKKKKKKKKKKKLRGVFFIFLFFSLPKRVCQVRGGSGWRRARRNQGSKVAQM